MNNENAKKKITFFDIIIGAVIIAVLAIIAYVLIISPTQKVEAEYNIEFTVELAESPSDISSLIKIGDAVTLSGKSRATVKSVESSLAKKLSPDLTTGNYTISVVPNMYDISATVTAPASMNDKDICVGNMPVKVGTKLALEGKGYSVDGIVTDMKLFDNNGEEIK